MKQTEKYTERQATTTQTEKYTERQATTTQVNKYLNFMKHGRNLAENTIKAIENDFIIFGVDNLETSLRMDIEAFVIDQNKQGLSSATIARRIASLKGFFDWQLYNGLRTGMNPAVGNIAPKIRNKSHTSVTREELDKLYNNAPTNVLKVAIALMGYAGLRIGEVVGLGQQNIVYRDENGTLAIHLKDTKGGGDRKVSLALLDQDLVNAIYHQGGLIGKRGVLSENGLWRQLKNYFNEMGFEELNPHGLRATFATLAVKAEMRVDVVRDIMGHFTLNGNAITSRYVGVVGVEEQAMELVERWN